MGQPLRPTAKCTAELVRGIDQSQLSIFSQDWWVNIARGSSDYHELKVVDRGTVIGRLPFVLSRNRLGLLRGHDPYWSHVGGPIVDRRLSRIEQSKVIQSLIEELPGWASFYFVCDSSLGYADLVRSAFQRAGFAHTTELTYVRYPSDGDVLDARKSKHKKHIKRAAKELEYVDISAREFVGFFETNLKTTGKRSHWPLCILIRLIEEATARGQARAIAVRSYTPIRAANNGHSTPYDAAIVYVWDDFRCYYWLSTRRITSSPNPQDMPHPDAIKLLAVKAMEDAQAMNQVFDVDGVTTSGTDILYRNMFGLRQEQHRDIFQRATIFERLYQSWSWSNFVSDEETLEIKGYTSPYFAAHMINQEWVQHKAGVHAMFPSSVDIKDGDGNLLVTSYAVHRPDGNWSLMLVNRDETGPHAVRVVFEDAKNQREASFSGTVTLVTFGSDQYVWVNDGPNSHADPDNPPVATTVKAEPGTIFTLPKASITVLRGKVGALRDQTSQ